MAINAPADFGFVFDGDSDVGDPGLCGPYTEDVWATLGRGAFTFDFAPNRGVYRGAGNEFQFVAVPGAQQIQIQVGLAVVNGTHAGTSITKTLDVPANALGAARKDRVVLRINLADAAEIAELRVLPGTTLAYAALTQNAPPDDIWEIPLWRWESPNGFADLTGVDEIDDRYWANLPSVLAPLLLNNSGSDQETGTVVIQDAGATSSFNTTTTRGDPAVIGATVEPIAAGATGKIAVEGLMQVMCDVGAVAVGDRLQASATAGQASAGTWGTFARAVSAKLAGNKGLVWALPCASDLIALELVTTLIGTPTNLVAMDTSTIFDESRVNITPDHLLGAREIYFEIRAKRTSANGLLVGARLVFGVTPLSVLQTSSMAYVTLRSSNLVGTLPSGAVDSVLYINNYNQNDNGLLAYARVIVVR